MKTIKIPGTDIYTSKLGFGTSSLHHLYKKSQRKELIYNALDNGYRHFDTARMYGEGLCEHALGDFLPKSMRGDITIATKFGIHANPLFERLPLAMYSSKFFNKFLKSGDPIVKRDITLNRIKFSLEKSLEALQTDWIDIFLLHEPSTEDIPMLEKSIEWLLEQKNMGRIKYLGLAGEVTQCIQIKKYFNSVFDILQIEDSTENKESMKLVKENMPVQITYGYMRRALTKDIETPAIEYLKKGLLQNPNGVILISTRSTHRLTEISNLV